MRAKEGSVLPTGPPGSGTAGVAVRGGTGSRTLLVRAAEGGITVLGLLDPLRLGLEMSALVCGHLLVATSTLAERHRGQLVLVDLLAAGESIRQHDERLAVVDGGEAPVLHRDGGVVPTPLLGAGRVPEEHPRRPDQEQQSEHASTDTNPHDWPPGLVYDDSVRLVGNVPAGHDLRRTIRSVRLIEGFSHQVLDLPERGGPGSRLEQEVLARPDVPHGHETARLVGEEILAILHLVAGSVLLSRLCDDGAGTGLGLRNTDRLTAIFRVTEPHRRTQDVHLRARVVVAAVLPPVVVAGSLPRTTVIPAIVVAVTAVAVAASNFDAKPRVADAEARIHAHFRAPMRDDLLRPDGDAEERDHDGRAHLEQIRHCALLGHATPLRMAGIGFKIAAR